MHDPRGILSEAIIGRHVVKSGKKIPGTSPARYTMDSVSREEVAAIRRGECGDGVGDEI